MPDVPLIDRTLEGLRRIMAERDQVAELEQVELEGRRVEAGALYCFNGHRPVWVHLPGVGQRSCPGCGRTSSAVRTASILAQARVRGGGR